MKITCFLKIKCHLSKYPASNAFSTLSVLHMPSPIIHGMRISMACSDLYLTEFNSKWLICMSLDY